MQLRTAFNARDIDTFRGLLADDARWGDDPNAPSSCHSRAEIVAQFKRLLADGVRGVNHGDDDRPTRYCVLGRGPVARPEERPA